MNNTTLLERINKLSTKQLRLLARQVNGHIAEKDQNPVGEQQRLAAYIVGNKNLDTAHLIYYLKNKLPDYMVPANVVRLDEIPRLPNGKIDVNNLPAIDYSPTWKGSEFVAPSTSIEKQLAAIWEQVLNFEPVGIHDNFFEIGGDSILSIQVVARARNAGVQLAANQLFEHQTIAELALFAKEKQEEKSAERELYVGPVSLLPIQHWFFEEHIKAPHHWNQTLLLEMPDFFNNQLCQQAVQYLIHRHEALRLCFSKNNNEWGAFILAPEKIKAYQLFDLSNSPETASGKFIFEISDKINAGFKLEDGSLFQAVYLENENAKNNQLLLVAHHLVVDNVSWQLILNDLKTIVEQLKAGNTISLPTIHSTYKTWTDFLMDFSKFEKIIAEEEFWKTQGQEPTKLPTDFEVNLPVDEASISIVNIELNKAISNELLNEAHAAYNTRTDELLIAALLKTINEWADEYKICLGLERYGRKPFNKKMDPSEIVGWMTSYFPVLFSIEYSNEIGLLIKSVKEQLRQVPNGGVGYGMLRYLNKNNENSFSQKPSIIFNYLGNKNTENSRIFENVEFLNTGTRSPLSERHHALEINAVVSDNQLQMNWGFSKKLHKEETMQALIEEFENNLRDIIDHCKDPSAGGYTPSDFSEAGLNQDDLDHLLANLEF